MLDRLLGLETEYAIRFTPRPSGVPVEVAGDDHPGNDLVFAAVVRAVRGIVRAQPPRPGRRDADTQIFTENGGALAYEMLPPAPRGGLLEAATPECRGPSQVLLYQRAEEALLLEALPKAAAELAGLGYEGELGLLKNCRDAEGHVYGAQENYEVELARGPALFAYRLGLVLLAPLLPLHVLFFWVVGLLYVHAGIYGWLALNALRRRAGRTAEGSEAKRDEPFTPKGPSDRTLGRVVLWAEALLRWPLVAPYTWLLRAFAFRRIRRSLTAFLVSRPVVTGAGTLAPDGALDAFGLSEKGPAMRRLIRTCLHPDNRPIFDTVNLMNGLSSVLFLRARGFFALFGRRQRLQLGLSDSNCAQVAEYLKTGTTSLVLDMIEAGFIPDAPRLTDPIAALHTIVRDPSLRAEVELREGAGQGTPALGRTATALQLQRWYLERARAFVAVSPVPSLEAREVVRLWGEALDALAVNPASLVGRLDWVTKRWLLETAGRDLDHTARKKIDLRYHELGRGYFARLEARGAAVVLVSPEEVAAAVRTPPSGSPARLRGRLVRELAGSRAPVTFSWDSVRIGGPLRGRLIRLAEVDD